LTTKEDADGYGDSNGDNAVIDVDDDDEDDDDDVDNDYLQQVVL